MFIHAKMRKGSTLSFVVFFAFRTVCIFIFVYKIKNNNQLRSMSTKRFISHIWMNDADQKDNESLMIRSSSSENSIPPKDVLFYILTDKNYHTFSHYIYLFHFGSHSYVNFGVFGLGSLQVIWKLNQTTMKVVYYLLQNNSLKLQTFITR